MKDEHRLQRDALSKSGVYKPSNLVYPVCIRNKESTTFICFDDNYRFMRVDKDDSNKETVWTYQFGLHYGWNKSRKPIDDEKYDAFFIEVIVSRHILISREEFIDEVEKFGDKFEEYKNFLLAAPVVRMPEVEEIILSPKEESEQAELNFSLEENEFEIEDNDE